MICTNCGKEVPDEAKVCGYCGHRLKSSVPVVEKQKEITEKPAISPVMEEPVLKKQKKMKIPVWLWIVGAVILMFVIFIIVGSIFSKPRIPDEKIVIAPSPGSNTGLPTVAATESIAVENPLYTEPGYLTPYLRNHLVNIGILSTETFDHWQENEWYTSDNIKTITDGNAAIELPGIEGLKTYICSPDMQMLQSGIITKFKLSVPLYQMEFFIAKGNWNEPGYRRFGGAIYETDHLETTIWEGTKNDLSNITIEGPLVFEPGRWYGLFIGKDSEGTFAISSWALDDPGGQYAGYQINLPESWRDGQYHACFQIGKGSIVLDDYSFLTFDSIKPTE